MCKLPYKIQPKNRVQLVQLINYAFKHKQYDLNFIDTSKITDMSYLFDNVNHNFDISCWDVSNVTNTEFMFDCCFEFKGKGLENWDVSKVEDMKYMFGGCDKLTIPNWYKLYRRK